MQDNVLLDVYIEIPFGGGIRQRLREDKPSPYKGTPENVPALGYVAYGCLPGIKNSADGDDVDVFVLGAEAAAITSHVKTKLIGIRFRLNGDHKLLTVLQGSTVWGHIRDVSELDENLRTILGRYVEKTEREGEFWGSAKEAKDWLQSLKP